MAGNREEASRARIIALKKLANKDYFGALRIARQAQRLYPELDNLLELLTVCEVYCAAEAKINGNCDLYAILQVEVTADDTVIRKQYDKLALLLHGDIPWAEAAFKLVSEAHATLCDKMKRSLYDIKRQSASKEVPNKATRLSSRIHANQSDWTGSAPPDDSVVLFWTICPHCQKRFVYYQRNFLVSCDDCGKNFFAFKLHEQAVPSRFLLVAPNNSQGQEEMFSCQLHGTSNHQVQHTKLRTTREDMDSEPMVYATQTAEHIRWGRRSDGDSESSCSETISSVVQFSSMNQTHPASPSVVKGITGSMAPDSTDPNLFATQNLRRENDSVLSAVRSFNFERLGKRKQDNGACSSYIMDMCDSKRQRNTSSTGYDLCSDNVSGEENQSAKHFPSKVDSKEEAIAIHESKKELIDTDNQMTRNPDITYECPDFFDFGKLRDINRIAVDQIWAIYDDHDFMPRVYARIDHVDASNLKVWLTWLERDAMNRQETKLIHEELPIAFGNFCLGEKFVLQDPSMYLSHRVSWAKGKNRNSFEIYPRKGEIWALYKELSILHSSVTDKSQSSIYDFVEVSSVSVNTGAIVFPLVRIEGFVSLFAKAKDKSDVFIPQRDLHRFSHSIPFYRTDGNEKVGVAEGLLELDTAALPCDLATSFPSINIS